MATQVTGPLVIVDAMNLFIRSYCVNPMMNINGERCGGTVGSLQSIKKILKDFSPSNMLVVWDGEGGSQRRKAIYKAYKEGRTVRLNKEYDLGESPEENLANLRKQRQNVQDYLALLGVPQIRCDGVEADDLMAYIAGKMDHVGGCVLITTDKDLLQMIRGKSYEHDCVSTGGDVMAHRGEPCEFCSSPVLSEVKVWSPIKRKMYDAKEFISEHEGVLPENYRLVKALTGDRSDNIKGIKGFGLATVVKYFPFITERKVAPKEILDLAEKKVAENGTGIVALKRLVEQKDLFWENLKIVDLSDPMLSARAARQARHALNGDMGCKELDFRIRVNRDSLQLTDDNLVQHFRDFVMRRRKYLPKQLSVEEEMIELMAADIEDTIDEEILQELSDTQENTSE